MSYNDERQLWLDEITQEVIDSDPASQVKHVHFVSTSKGRGRPRKWYKEIDLYHYHDGYHLWCRFHPDKVATEVLQRYDATADELLSRIRTVDCLRGKL